MMLGGFAYFNRHTNRAFLNKLLKTADLLFYKYPQGFVQSDIFSGNVYFHGFLLILPIYY